MNHESTYRTPAAAHVAVIGGGITGACVASSLQQCSILVDVFDQGQRGPGGRASHRNMEPHHRWDHGCQFFRADTDRFKAVTDDWLAQNICQVWSGEFKTDNGDFFGFPSQPPFYYGVGGMKTIIDSLLHGSTVYSGQRVSNMQRENGKWMLFGTTGDAAYHDSSEKVARAATEAILGNVNGYDAVVLTDVSSSFGSWHRASAGIPESFAAKVRERAGSRTPLFAAMVAFDGTIPFDAASFDDDVLWFVAKTSSKPGLDHVSSECWTLVSSPEYAIKSIEETPMQDPKTGEFIPQSKDYMESVPGPDLERAFRRILESGKLGDCGKLPSTTFLSAQRWGSAMPSRRQLETARTLSGVLYDRPIDLAPTSIVRDGPNFVADSDLMLFQAGDMVSNYSPGFEGAALSGLDVADHLSDIL